MCGEMEEENSREEEAYARFVAHAHSMIASMKAAAKGKKLDPLHAYLDAMFRNSLLTAADHNRTPDDIDHYQRLTMEPLVFGGLAGFIAAHLALEDDPLRRVIEALMMGYAEGEIALPEHDHEHPHGPGFGHSHPH